MNFSKFEDQLDYIKALEDYLTSVKTRNLMSIIIPVTIILALSCFFGDLLLKLVTNDLLRALIDNLTHAIIAALSWLIVLLKCNKRTSIIFNYVFELFLSAFIGSVIDIDHFVLAKSFNLKNALNLGKRRPPLHCTTLPVLILVVSLTIGWIYDSPKIWRIGWLTWVSFFSHHIRDSIRRGIWLWPLGSTPPLPYYLYILTTIALPYLTIILLNDN